MNNFAAYSQYYDLLNKDKDYQTEADYIHRLIQRYNSNASSILELGCGSGNHATHLTNKGYSITGIEQSQTMLEQAVAKHIPGFHPLLGDITNFRIDRQFDCAISLFHVISYLTNTTALVNCFINVEKHLKSKGIFIFDVWYSPAVYTQKPETRIRRMENDYIKITRIAESRMKTESNTVNVEFEVLIEDKTTHRTEVIKEVHPMKHFSIPEIELLAIQTGFAILKTEEFLTGKNPDTSTWGVNFVLQKQY